MALMCQFCTFMAMEGKLRIVLAEDNPALARSLADKLSFFEQVELVWSAKHGRDLLEKLEKDSDIDIILMDINMPVMDGIQATKEVRKNWPGIRIIMSTVFDEEEYIFQAIMAGANGYLLKDEKADRILSAILDVQEGGAPMSPGIAFKALELLRKTHQLPEVSPDFRLTKRETEILEQLSRGQNYNQIAAASFISPGTVRKHIENIYQKLQVHNKVEAVQLAMKHRII